MVGVVAQNKSDDEVGCTSSRGSCTRLVGIQRVRDRFIAVNFEWVNQVNTVIFPVPWSAKEWLFNSK